MANLTLFDYSTIFMVGSSYLAMVVGYYYRNKFIELKWLFLYPLASFLQVSFGHFILRSTTLFPDEESQYKISDGAIEVFFILELFFIYTFFNRVLKSATLKRKLYMIGGIFGIVVLLSLNMSKNIEYLLLSQSILALLPCYLYFRSLFEKHFLPDLRRSPTFWVAIGITLYFSCTFPLFTLANYVWKLNILYGEMLYSINFIFYGVLFLMIARAYLFKKQNN